MILKFYSKTCGNSETDVTRPLNQICESLPSGPPIFFYLPHTGHCFWGGFACCQKLSLYVALIASDRQKMRQHIKPLEVIFPFLYLQYVTGMFSSKEQFCHWA